MRRRCRALAVLVSGVLFATACGGEGGSDGGTDAGAPDASGVVAIPWRSDGVPPIVSPMLTPCPMGWSEARDGDLTHCEAHPSGMRASCDAGEAHFPGEPGCRSIGDPCPSGAYADLLPPDGVTYVRADATPGGDGTLAAPYASLSDVAWSGLPAGAVVALGKGTYEGVLALRAGVSVIGACVAETIVTGLDSPTPAVVSVTTSGEPVVIRNLTIADAPQRGVQLRGGHALRLEGVALTRVEELAILVADAGSELVMSDVVIRDVRPLTDGTLGRAINVQAAGRVEATRLVVESASDIGVYVAETGSEVVLRDVDVRGTLAGIDGGFGLGADVGGRLEATRVVIDGSESAGVFGAGSGSELVLEDVVVRASEGPGIEIQEGTSLALRRALVEGNREIGVFLVDEGTRATLEDVVIRGTRGRARDSTGGRGVALQAGAHLEAARIVVERNRHIGVFVSGAGTTATLADGVVRDTIAEESTLVGGWGVAVQTGAHLDATRLLLDRNLDVGLSVVSDGSITTITDATMRDTLPHVADGRGGHGVHAQAGGSVDATRVLITGSRSLGVASVGGAVAMRDVAIERVEPAMCAMTTCADAPLGYGAAAVGGSLRLTGFEVSDASVCGVLVAPLGAGDAGMLDLTHGVVSRALIGACVQVDGYDLTRLTDDVSYRDNGANLESTMLPVPAPLDALGG